MAGFYYPSPCQNGYGYNPYGTVQIPQPTPQQMVQPIPQQNGQQSTQQQNQMPQQSQMMNGGFIHVQSENEARQYPVAPGNSVTFIDDVQSFCYTKTMPFTQFEPPLFKKFKLVEVIDNAPTQNAQESPSEPTEKNSYDLSNYALKSDLEGLRAEFENLVSKMESLTVKAKATTKKEADKNEQST